MIPLEKTFLTFSSRFKATKNIFVNRKEAYYVFKGIDLSRLDDDFDFTKSEKKEAEVLIFLQLLKKVETNRANIMYFCDYLGVDEHKDFVFRGPSNYFFYICVLKYNEDVLKYI